MSCIKVFHHSDIMVQRPKTDIVFQQWFTGIGASLILMQAGFVSGWASPTLARLTSPDSPIAVTADEASWIAALANLGRLFGAVLGPVAVNFLGSKKAILSTLALAIIGWIVTIFANAVVWFYVARIFTGLGLGMTFSIYPLYLGEVSIPGIRGALISLANSGFPIGQIIASVCGSMLSISMAAVCFLVCCLFLVLLFVFVPESPYHLAKIGKDEEARKSLSWYRNGKDIDKEYEAVQQFLESSRNDSFCKKLRNFRVPSIRNALLQVMVLYTFMQFSGLNSVVFYMETILKRAKFTLLPPSEVVIYVSVLGAMASFTAIFLIDRFGRRFLIILSGIGVCCSMFMLMSYFYVMNEEGMVEKLNWLPMCALFVFIVSFSMGLLTVPGTVLGEIFPASIKCTAACLVSLVGGLMAFLSTKTYQPMVDGVGESAVFLMYGVIAFIAIPYALFIMPETKGKSLLQIQDDLQSK